jgi:L-lactate dehydrogenase (cytochrome)
VTWKDIEWLRTIWSGNLVLKGILDVRTRAKRRVGADGMIVSNHGGRQLDGVCSSGIAMLPRIADAVGSETTLLVDGGVRNGQDVVKALALGAKAALDRTSLGLCCGRRRPGGAGPDARRLPP